MRRTTGRRGGQICRVEKETLDAEAKRVSGYHENVSIQRLIHAAEAAQSLTKTLFFMPLSFFRTSRMVAVSVSPLPSPRLFHACMNQATSVTAGATQQCLTASQCRQAEALLQAPPVLPKSSAEVYHDLLRLSHDASFRTSVFPSLCRDRMSQPFHNSYLLALPLRHSSRATRNRHGEEIPILDCWPPWSGLAASATAHI